MLVEHVKDEHGDPVATLLAMNVDGKIVVGWSKRHPVCDPQPFTKRIGRNWAKLRALAEGKHIQLQSKPVSVARHPEFEEIDNVYCQVDSKEEQSCKLLPYVFQFGVFDRFLDRCKKYYEVDSIANVSE